MATSSSQQSALTRPAAAAAAAAGFDTVAKLSRMLSKMNAEAKANRQLKNPKLETDRRRSKALSESSQPSGSSGSSNHACRPDRPGCRPVIMHLPDELYEDPSSGDEDDNDDDDDDEEEEEEELEDESSSGDDDAMENGEEDEKAAEEREQRKRLRLLLPQPLKRNGHQLTLKVDDANLRNLLQSIADRFQPGQPDMLDRVIAMFNSGRCLGPEGEAQLRRLRVQQRRRLLRRLRRSLDPNWSPGRRLMSMAECFRSLGHILGGDGGDSTDGSGVVNGSAPDSTPSPTPLPFLEPSELDTTDADYPDEGLAIASPSPTMSPSPPASPSPPPQPSGELRLEITEESLARLGSLTPDGESHFRNVLLGLLRVPATRYCLSDAQLPVQHRWLRHCARQSSQRRDWDRRLADGVGEMLQRRLSAVLYDPEVCSRLTSLLASDLLELVMHELGAEFKVIGLLSIGSVTEIDRMAMTTRSAYTEGVDCCRAFHYQNESVFALFTCHLFQRFDRLLLSEDPLDIDDPVESPTEMPAEEAADDACRQCDDTC